MFQVSPQHTETLETLYNKQINVNHIYYSFNYDILLNSKIYYKFSITISYFIF